MNTFPFQRKLYNWLRRTSINAQSHQPSGKRKSKPWWDNTSHLLGWLESKSVLLSIGENMEKLEPSYTAVGNVKWHSHLRTQSSSPTNNYRVIVRHRNSTPRYISKRIINTYPPELSESLNLMSFFLNFKTTYHPQTQRKICLSSVPMDLELSTGWVERLAWFVIQSWCLEECLAQGRCSILMK